MSHCITPIDPNIYLFKDQCSSTDKKKIEMSKISYREAVGSLMWATVATQPAIALKYHYFHSFLKTQGKYIGNQQKSDEVSKRDKELQVIPWEQSQQLDRLCRCILGIARLQALNICIYLPDRWRKYLLELSETEHCCAFIN